MKYEKKKLKDSVLEFIIEESVKNISQERKQVLKNLKENADIKGFRKGKVPEEFIIKKYGEDEINRMAVDYAIDRLYKDAIRKEGIVPVSEAKVTEIISESPLKFKIEVEIFPEIEIKKSYKDIKLKKTKVEVTDKEVEKTLEDIQTRFTKFEEADKKYKIKKGDKATIDTTGFDKKGKVLENTEMQDYPLVIGSNILVPGFEDGLIGKLSGEELELPITFPKDYHNANFAGKETNFKVKIKKIEKSVKPEFTKEFIKDLRGKDLDLDGFKELIKNEIFETKEANTRMEDENKLLDEIFKITKIEIGENLLKRQIEKVYEEVKENIARDNVKVSDYLDSLKMTEEQYKEKQIKPIAEKRLKGELILHKIVELEKPEIKDEEVQKEIKVILDRFSSKEASEKLKDLYKKGTSYYEQLKQRMIYRKVVDSFFE